jgi:hypothetical protein
MFDDYEPGITRPQVLLRAVGEPEAGSTPPEDVLLTHV